MIRSITITNFLGNSIVLELEHPEKSGFVVKAVDGLGPGTANINTTEVVTNDGGIYNSARLPQRNIVISIMFMWKDDIEESRHRSYTFFPIKKPLTLMIETDTRKCEIEGYVETNDPAIFDKEEGSEISIICPYPYFYSAGDDGKQITYFGGVEALFEFPFSNESLLEKLLIMGEILTIAQGTVVYVGDADVGMTIRIHALGKASNITLYNVKTQESMFIDTDKIASITGSGIVALDDIIITTIKGKKSIVLLRDGETTNILNCLGKNTDWFTLSRGDNVFAFTAETGQYNLQVTIENRVLYEGV